MIEAPVAVRLFSGTAMEACSFVRSSSASSTLSCLDQSGVRSNNPTALHASSIYNASDYNSGAHLVHRLIERGVRGLRGHALVQLRVDVRGGLLLPLVRLRSAG
jgi:hypothetical protein